MQVRKSKQTFHCCVLSPFSDDVGSRHLSNVRIKFNETTRRYITEGCHLHLKIITDVLILHYLLLRMCLKRHVDMYDVKL
jgi:hypothetical protein